MFIKNCLLQCAMLMCTAARQVNKTAINRLCFGLKQFVF